jgi:hypothetical protein
VGRRIEAIEGVRGGEGGEVGVFDINHVGGHKWAGVLLVSTNLKLWGFGSVILGGVKVTVWMELAMSSLRDVPRTDGQADISSMPPAPSSRMSGKLTPRSSSLPAHTSHTVA